MSGYNHQAGMSNNAVDAYENGLVTLSKITVKELKSAGLEISKNFAKWLAKENHWNASEWHHSGGSWYNKIKFYSIAELADLINDDTINIAELKIEFKNSLNVADEKPVKGHFATFGGSRKHPTFLGNEEFTGILKGNWIHLPCGMRKKANGNNITWEYLK